MCHTETIGMRKETWPVRRRHAAHIGRIQPGFWQGYVQRRECNITGKNGKEMQKKKLWIFFWSPLLFREVYESESDELVCWWNWVFRIYLPLFNTTPVGGLCRGVEKESKSRGFSNFRSPFFSFSTTSIFSSATLLGLLGGLWSWSSQVRRVTAGSKCEASGLQAAWLLIVMNPEVRTSEQCKFVCSRDCWKAWYAHGNHQFVKS